MTTKRDCGFVDRSLLVEQPKSTLVIQRMGKPGSTILRFGAVSSTNDVARGLAAAGKPEWLCVVAQEQTAGRGRQGRSWSSPSGDGLYLSFILRPDIKPADSTVLTLAAAVAVAETLKFDFQVSVDIKWPNDILASGRKLCGILVESAIEGGRLQFAIVGIGVNVGQLDFPTEIRETATSLSLEAGRHHSPEDLLMPLLTRLQYWCPVAITDPPLVISRWEELSTFARDCAVRIESADSSFEGVTRGLASTGALIVELSNGETREIVSGEVSLRALAAPC